MRKFLTYFFIVLIIIFSQSLVYGNEYKELNQDKFVIVTRVFDGETLEVKTINGNDYYLIKLIGVDAQGYNDAYMYMNDAILGQSVYVQLSNSVESPIGRWNLVFLNYNNEVINDKLLKMGYGVAKKDSASTGIYSKYLSIEETAKNNMVGLWEGEEEEYYSKNAININTASSSQLIEHLDISSTLASRIIEYRKNNPFNTIDELKFVESMTNYIYNKNKNRINVVTNILNTEEYEIESLKGISNSEARAIVKYRDSNKKIDFEELRDEGIISSEEYSDNKNFVSTNNKQYTNYIYGNKSVNINTGSAAQLKSAGFSTTQYNIIEKLIDSGYTFKTQEEIYMIQDIGLSESEFNKIEDNFNVMTDINNASKYELESLFGSEYKSSEINKIIDDREFEDIEDIKDIIGSSKYNKIKDYIYVNDYETDYVNINTASMEEMEKIGISESKSSKINNHSGLIEDLSEIPVDITSFDRKITLYTNINFASRNELKSLSRYIDDDIANAIINYRNSDRFATYDELKTFLNSEDEKNIYNQIKDYVVFR